MDLYRNISTGASRKSIRREKRNRLGSSPNSSYRNNVLVSEPHISSSGFLVLLHNYYSNYWKWNVRDYSQNRFNSKFNHHRFGRIRKRFIKEQKNAGKLFCWYCGCSVIHNPDPKGILGDSDLTVDHIHPKHRGGLFYDMSNLAISCHSCNEEKAECDVSEYVSGKGYVDPYVLEYMG